MLALVSLAGAYWLAPAFAWLLAGYFALSFSYSMYFKRIVLLDVFLLAGLYILRIVGGHLVTGIAFSEWLFSFVVRRTDDLAHRQSSAEDQRAPGRAPVFSAWTTLVNVDARRPTELGEVADHRLN